MEERFSSISGSNATRLLPQARAGVLVKDNRIRPRHIALGVVAFFFILVGLISLLASLLVSETEGESVPFVVSATREALGITPASLLIPVLGIETSVEHVGVNTRGNMAVPSNYVNVAWYSPGTLPGDEGNAVMAGHLDNSLGLAGVFENLHRLRMGDTVVVRSIRGEARTFRVKEMTVYDAGDAPEERVFGNAGKH